MKSLKDIANKLGVDNARAYSSGARIVQVFTGVCSISFFTGVEQVF